VNDKVKRDGDYAWGAREIGETVERSPRWAYYAIEHGLLDGVVKKVSGKHCGERKAIRQRVFGGE
jgi:hypothetical protein